MRNPIADTVAGGDAQFVPISSWQVLNGEGRRKYLSAAERRALLAAADMAPASIRALVYVLTFSGCRISEALNLTAHQIDAEQCRLIVRTLKRRRLIYRAVPVPRQVIDLTTALRPAVDGRIWRMHRTTAYRHVKGLMAQARIIGPMACCRGCRHGYGIHAAASAVPANLITKWMGHADAERPPPGGPVC